MGNKKEIIIDIDVSTNSDAAGKKVAELQMRLEQLKKKTAELREAYDSGAMSTDEFTREMGKLNAQTAQAKEEMHTYGMQMKNALKVEQEREGSLKSLRAELSATLRAYDALSKEERESAEGKDMLNKINSLTTEIKDAEYSTQRFQRNVGNYMSAFESFTGPIGKAVSSIKSLTAGNESGAKGFAAIKQSVGAFGKELWGLCKIPIVAIISAIVAVLVALAKEFKKNDDAMTALQSLFSAFKPILDIINKAFAGLVKLLVPVIEGISKFVQKVMSIIPGMKQFAQAEEDLVRSTDKLEDVEREYVEAHSERDKKIAELNNKSVQSNKYSLEERKAFVKEAMRLEEEDMKARVVIAKEKLRLLVLEAQINNDTSDETKNKISELKAAVNDAEREYAEGTRRLSKRMDTFMGEERAKWKKAAEDRKKRLEVEKKEIQAAMDAALDIIGDSIDKQIKVAEEQGRRTISALRARLKDEKDLTKTAREAINEQIVLTEAKLQLELSRLREQYSRNSMLHELDYRKSILDEQLKIIGDATEDGFRLRKQMEELSSEMEVEAIRGQVSEWENANIEIRKFFSKTAEEQQRTAKTAGMTVTEYREMLSRQLADNTSNITNANNIILAKQTAHARTMEELEREHQKTIENIRKSTDEKQFDNDIQQRLYDIDTANYKNAEVLKSQILEDQAAHRYQVAKNEVERLNALNDEQIKGEFDTQEKYNKAVADAQGVLIQSQQQWTTAMKNTTKALTAEKAKAVETFSSIGSAISTAMSSMNGMFTALAENNEKYNEFATGVAMAQILISSAVSIAQAIQAAVQAGGFTGPAAAVTIPVFIAELVGIVGAGIASAVSTLNQAKQAKTSKPSFATGGLVRGAGTGTSDSVQINASNGEYVIKAAKVEEYGVGFFDRLNFGHNVHHLGKSRFADGGLVTLPTGAQKTAFDMDDMRAALESAMQGITPIVSVKEITSIQNRVRVKETISKR